MFFPCRWYAPYRKVFHHLFSPSPRPSSRASPAVSTMEWRCSRHTSELEYTQRSQSVYTFSYIIIQPLIFCKLKHIYGSIWTNFIKILPKKPWHPKVTASLNSSTASNKRNQIPGGSLCIALRMAPGCWPFPTGCTAHRCGRSAECPWSCASQRPGRRDFGGKSWDNLEETSENQLISQWNWENLGKLWIWSVDISWSPCFLQMFLQKHSSGI